MAGTAQTHRTRRRGTISKSGGLFAQGSNPVGRRLGERSGSWWKTIGVQSAYRPAVLEWERASDPRSPLEPDVLCGGAPDFYGMLSGLLHGRRSPLAPPAL